MSACAGHKQFDYNSAYKFSKHNYQSTTDQIEIPIQSAQTDDVHLKIVPIDIVGISPTNRIYSNYSFSNQLNYTKLPTIDTRRKLTRAEKKHVRRELRATLRNISNEQWEKDGFVADIDNVGQVHEDDTSKKKRKIARYLLIGGGVLLITAVIVGSVPVLGGVGAAAIIAGAVLMLLSLDK